MQQYVAVGQVTLEPPSAGPVTADTIIRCAIWVSSSLRGAIQRVAGRKNVAEHHWRARAPCHTKQLLLMGQGSKKPLIVTSSEAQSGCSWPEKRTHIVALVHVRL